MDIVKKILKSESESVIRLCVKKLERCRNKYIHMRSYSAERWDGISTRWENRW